MSHKSEATPGNSVNRGTAMPFLRWSARIIIFAAVSASAFAQETTYPPLREYMMPRDAEIALAKTAAPENVSGHASIKVLTAAGYETAQEGDNGFVCIVMRGWGAPTFTPAQLRGFVYDAKIRAPICFDPIASKTVLPYYELRSKLGMAGKSPDQITEGVAEAYAKGTLPRRETVSFAYMFSGEQNLGANIGHWHPHIMVFAPYYDNALIGGNALGSPYPLASDDADTPFAVIVIQVDGKLAVKQGGHTGMAMEH